MHLNNKPPIFVPFEFRAEIEALSKAALMDIAWDFAAQMSGDPDAPDAVMRALRDRIEIIKTHRKQAAS